MLITIHVSPLTYKILTREYPCHEKTGTIKVSSQSLIIKQLTAGIHVGQHRTDHLTKVINIVTEKNIQLTDEQKASIAVMWHIDHTETMMLWIQSAVIAGQTASYGIRSFMSFMDIDDDDINRETTFRQWQRYVRRNTDLLEQPKSKITQPPPARQLDENKFAWFIADIVEHIYNNTNTFNNLRLRALRLTALNHEPHISMSVDPMGYHPKAAYSAISRCKVWIKKHHAVRKAWEKYYGELK
jgi:hypothetical protein